MHQLIHFPLCPHSRAIRLALAETGVEFALSPEVPWALSEAFLGLNPAGDFPVLRSDDGLILAGAYALSEYLSEEIKRHPGEDEMPVLFPGNRVARAEVRRLVSWFHGKLDREVTREIVHEKVVAPSAPGSGHTPDADILRAARANLRYHLKYVSHLAVGRNWLAGEDFSYADMAAAGHVSTLDYLGEIAWDEHPGAKGWYQRIKSRPSFRALLGDRIAGMPPPQHYTDLDF